MRAIRLLTGVFVVAAGVIAAEASAAELKVLSPEGMRPALQELASDFEKESGHKLKIDYVSATEVEKKAGESEDYDVVIVGKAGTEKLRKQAKIVGGTIKTLGSENGSSEPYIASSPMLSEQPAAAKALVDFLGGPKAKEVYKAKGLQPS